MMMRHSQTILRWSLSILLATTTAALVPAAAAAQTGPEVGIGIGHLTMTNDDGGRFAASPVNLRVAAPLSEAWSIEGIVTVEHRQAYGASTTEGLYGALFKRHFNASAVWSPFLTVGAVGIYQSVVTRGWTEAGASPPFYAALGGGARQRLGERISAEESLEEIFLLWFPAGFRATASLSIRIGSEHR